MEGRELMKPLTVFINKEGNTYATYQQCQLVRAIVKCEEDAETSKHQYTYAPNVAFQLYDPQW